MLAVGWATELPRPSAAEVRRVASGFAFAPTELRPVSVDGFKTQRPVAPHLSKLRTWMSGVGASIALTDLQGSGFSRDLCWVDPRTDTVTITPAPGTPAAYAPFAVDPAPLTYSRATMAPTGCLPGDFDEDGSTDLLVYYWGRTPVVFLRSPATPLSAAAFRPLELWPGAERWYTDSVNRADVDGDGHPDLIIGNYFPDGARILDATAEHDPAFQMNDSMASAFNGGRNHIMLWRPGAAGSLPFQDAGAVFGEKVAHGWTLAIGAQDFNGDGLPELYFANDFGPDRLMVNRSTPGQVRFTEVTGSRDFTTPKSKSLGHDSFKGMGVDFGDLNGDGRTDMFVSNISSQRGLMETNFAWVNTGDPVAVGAEAPFAERSDSLHVARTGWGWDAKIDDFANDGRPEIVQATGFAYGKHDTWPQVAELAMENDQLVKHPTNWMQSSDDWGLAAHDQPAFLAWDGDRFVDVTTELGLDQGITRAIATGDVDGDGRLDLAIAGQWGPSFFYRNTTPDAGLSLDLRLLRPLASGGTPTVTRDVAVRGIPVIGARATVTLPSGDRYTAQVDGGNGHASARSTDLHFGLGELPAGTPIAVRVDWRSTDGTQQSRDYTVTAGRWSIVLG
ncbi:FG-GAP repeat protein [Asanoa ferruginea]|uniref:FG-GAP repeat protein n=1 Tax=Asanoa ferruginea TaxID=53367 RepID=A0A3D9ZPT8_9ACTN|nr:FG-GAP repeat protein [Asanoa ferruginea]